MAYQWKALLAVCLGIYMVTMDGSITNIAIPTLAHEFHVSPNTALWVSLANFLAVTGLTLTVGRIGDLFGRKRVYSLGFLVFTIGLALAALSQSLTQLIAVRVVQSLGAAMVIANGTSITAATFPPSERGRALGFTTGFAGAGQMSGPAIGGLLLDALDWRALFYLRIPIGLIALVIAWWVLRVDRTTEGRRTLDLPGAATLFLTLSSFLLAINRGQTWGWLSPTILGLLALSVIMGFAFVRVERRAASPVVALELFRERALTASVVSSILNFLGQGAVTLLLPFYLLRVLGASSVTTGLVLMAVPSMMLLFSVPAGMLADKIGSRLLATLGVALMALGILSLATLQADTPLPLVVGRLMLIGVATTLFQSPNMNTIMGLMPRHLLGAGSGTIATSRSIGNAVGLALGGAVFTAVAASRAGIPGAAVRADTVSPADTLAGLHVAFLVAGALTACGVAASLFRASGADHASTPARPTPEPNPGGR